MQDQSQYRSTSDPSPRKIKNDHKIRVIFRGFIIARIKEGTGEQAWIGALHRTVSECHRPKIRVYKLFLPAPGASGAAKHGHSEDVTPAALDPEVDITLTANPVGTGIELFQTDIEPFNRLDERHNSRNDFRWFINLNEIHGEPVGIVDAKISPRFKINRGLFYTSDRSEGELKIVQQNGSPPKHFGKFALELTTKVYLPDAGSSATCMGNVELFPPISGAESAFKYDVVYDCSCRVNEDATDSDFPLIYDAIRVSDPTKKVDMSPDDLEERASPEVYCMGGNTFP